MAESALQDRLRAAIAGLDGVTESESMFKDAQAYWANGKEIAHFDGEDVIDIRLTRALIRARRAELRADQRVELRSSSSDWISVRIAEPADVTFAAALTESAADAHRAQPGTTAKPAPSGSDLARRKRFH
jgi:hypothetical protein